MRHYRLTIEDALTAHERALACGGVRGVINLGSIESAISRPYSGYHRTIYRKAAAFTESMVGNHGFADANKRTTVILLHLLLEQSGYRLMASAVREAVQEMILSVARSELSFNDLVRWFEGHVVKT